MADPTARALALVSTARTTTTAQGEVARRVQAVLETHRDIASEACWQDLSRVIAQDWLVLCRDQPPIATWQMLTRCAETVLKLRRVAKRGQGQGDGGEAALEEFRTMMRQVMGRDTQK